MKGPNQKKTDMTDSEMDDPGDGGATAVVMGLLLVVFVVIAAFYYFGINAVQSRPVDIDVHARQVTVAPART